MKKRILVNDIILVFFLLVLPLFLFLSSNSEKEHTEYIQVYYDGNLTGTYSLSGKDDGQYSPIPDLTVTVKAGRAYISYSDCPDKLCMSGYISKSRSTALVCLPNRVSVTAKRNGGVDDIAG